MSLVVLGINHHRAPVSLRERATIPVEERGRACEELVDSGSIDEAVVISTCNRTELVLRAQNGEKASEAGRAYFARRCVITREKELADVLFEQRDQEAVRHLFEVITSLDSLVIGEPHIIGQVREDFERAKNAGTVGKVLNRLFYRAFELAKTVRRQTSIGESPVSVSSIALDLAARVFGSVEGRKVLVLGAGEMGRQTAILAGHRGAAKIIVTSRTKEHAQELASRVKGKVIAWDDREKAMEEVDLIIGSTGAPEPIIDKAQMSRVMQGRRHRPIFLIDIALPRDVNPDVDTIYNLYRYDLDDLTGVAKENEARRQGAIPDVIALIEQTLSDFEQWCETLRVVPTIVNFREFVEEIRKEELESYLRRLGELGDRERNLVDALTNAITQKIMHLPTVRLKEATAKGTDARHAGSLRYLFNLESRDSVIPRAADNEESDENS